MSDALGRGKSWMRTTGSDGRQHVVYVAEEGEHELTTECKCMPQIDGSGVVIHETYTPNPLGLDTHRQQ